MEHKTIVKRTPALTIRLEPNAKVVSRESTQSTEKERRKLITIIFAFSELRPSVTSFSG